MCIGMHLGKDSFSVVSKNDMGEETHKHYCQIVLSTKTRIFIWEEKKKRKPRKGKKSLRHQNLPSLLEIFP